MNPKDEPTKDDEIVVTKKPEPQPETPGTHEHGRRRKHGYRGYPNNPSIGGDVHMGSGFAGVGAAGGAASGSGVIGEKTQESVEELEEKDEE